MVTVNDSPFVVGSGSIGVCTNESTHFIFIFVPPTWAPTGTHAGAKQRTMRDKNLFMNNIGNYTVNPQDIKIKARK